MTLVRITLLACAFMVAAPASASAQTVTPGRYGPPIPVSEAQGIINRGMAASAAKGLTMAFAVVEPSGELVAFARMADAPYASTQLAQQKARASARLRLPTAELETRVQAGRICETVLPGG